MIDFLTLFAASCFFRSDLARGGAFLNWVRSASPTEVEDRMRHTETIRPLLFLLYLEQHCPHLQDRQRDEARMHETADHVIWSSARGH